MKEISERCQGQKFFLIQSIGKVSQQDRQDLRYVHEAELPLAIIQASRLEHAQIRRLIDDRMHHSPRNPAKISPDVFSLLCLHIFHYLNQPSLIGFAMQIHQYYFNILY